MAEVTRLEYSDSPWNRTFGPSPNAPVVKNGADYDAAFQRCCDWFESSGADRDLRGVPATLRDRAIDVSMEPDVTTRAEFAARMKTRSRDNRGDKKDPKRGVAMRTDACSFTSGEFGSKDAAIQCRAEAALHDLAELGVAEAASALELDGALAEIEIQATREALIAALRPLREALIEDLAEHYLLARREAPWRSWGRAILLALGSEIVIRTEDLARIDAGDMDAPPEHPRLGERIDAPDVRELLDRVEEIMAGAKAKEGRPQAWGKRVHAREAFELLRQAEARVSQLFKIFGVTFPSEARASAEFRAHVETAHKIETGKRAPDAPIPSPEVDVSRFVGLSATERATALAPLLISARRAVLSALRNLPAPVRVEPPTSGGAPTRKTSSRGPRSDRRLPARLARAPQTCRPSVGARSAKRDDRDPGVVSEPAGLAAVPARRRRGDREDPNRLDSMHGARKRGRRGPIPEPNGQSRRADAGKGLR